MRADRAEETAYEQVCARDWDGVVDVSYAGFGARNTDAAAAAGLVCRPLQQTLADVLDREVAQGPGRDDRAGLSPQDERLLITAARR